MKIKSFGPFICLYFFLLGVPGLGAQEYFFTNHVHNSRPDIEPNNFFQISNSILKSLNARQIDVLSFRLPINDNVVTIHLQEESFLPPNLQIQRKSGGVEYVSNIRTFRGYVEGMANNSLVTLTSLGSEVRLWLSIDNEQYDIFKEGHHYVLTKDLPNQIDRECKTKDAPVSCRDGNGSNRSQADCIELFVELDYELYLANGSDLNEASLYITSIINSVGAIYEVHNIPISLRGIKINDLPDNYPASLIPALNQFVNSNSSGFNGKIAFLMSGLQMGGGVSQGIGGFCKPLTSYPAPFAIAGDMTVPSQAFPTYSYNVYIVAHELGHVMGLRHTHACVWNGNNTQIDDCGNVVADQNGETPEGLNCFDPINPILPGTAGTIMSYCNLLSGQSVDFNQSFGPVAGAVLYDNFINSSCHLGDICRTIPPINDDCIDAIPLVISNTCQLKTYDNEFASASGETPGFSCGNAGSTVDVWFSIEVPSSGNVTVEVDQAASGLTNTVMQVYSGSCGNLSTIDCDDNSGNGDHPLIIVSNRTPGEVIYIRLIDNGSNDSGDFSICAYDTSVPCHPSYNDLVDFYNNMNGPAWTINSGWLEGAADTDCDICNWHGVLCNANGQVVEINLPNNNLSNPLHTSLGNLPYLEKINLYSNNISGAVPVFLKDIPLLTYCDLAFNQLNGNIPSELGSCPNLLTLYLDNNQLSGPLPSSLINTPMTTFWANANDLSGCLPNNFVQFCARAASVDLSNNPLLPFGGNYPLLCADSLGADFDMDGFCGGDPDCDDTNATVFPGAPEICDGLDNDCNLISDDNVTPVDNIWLGNTKNWQDANNWSTGFVPQICHDVVVDPIVLDSCIVYANSIGQARSLLVGSNGVLLIQNFADLNVTAGGNVTNNGVVSTYGDLNVGNATGVASSIENNGVFLVGSSGRTVVSGMTSTGILNANGATFTNLGLCSVMGVGSSMQIGLDCYGMFNNFGTFETENINLIDLIFRQSSGSSNDEGNIILKE